MKKVKIITAVFVMIWAAALSLDAIQVDPAGTHYIGDTLTFRPANFAFNSVAVSNWSFGDGGIATAKGMEAVTHSYSTPGTYLVKVEGLDPDAALISETASVRILQPVDNRYIDVTPDQPVAGQPATFRAFNFSAPDNIRWDMGDGTILSQPSNSRQAQGFSRDSRRPQTSAITGTNVVTHTYLAPGRYTVRAYDFGGDDANPVVIAVNVQLPPRSITYTPVQPLAGAPVQFTAVNFLSDQVDWNFGDGTIFTGTISVSHVYNNAGTYTVTAKEANTNLNPVSVRVIVRQPDRRIIAAPQAPRVDQPVFFQAQNFITNSIDWNFGDGTIVTGASTTITHRFQTQGIYTVSAKDSAINHSPVTIAISIAAENRYIMVSPPEVRTNETVTVTAFNFRGDFILWDFGDGTQRSGLQTETHQYRRAGNYIITAQDENGESQKKFTTSIIVRGIDDQVNLQIAEIVLDNGKHYKIVPKNSKNIRAVLRMKMRGTGIVSGYWLVDGHPFEFFNEVSNQGEVKEISTRRIPGLPTIDPGIHTITLQLTRPANIPVTFPILKYFVLSHENIIATVTPADGFVAKEKEIPEFSWEEPKGASKYQIAFANYLYAFLGEDNAVSWLDAGTRLKYTPAIETWNNISRNRWTYWQVRALDTNNNVVAESDIHDIKVVIATAEISVDKVTDLEGNEIALDRSGNLATRSDDLLVRGNIEYMGASEYLVLRVYVDEELTDQLLFRDVKKHEKRYFETSIANKKKVSRIRFTVLKTSSPAVIIGIKGLMLRR
jgi:PKD repeat protein